MIDTADRRPTPLSHYRPRAFAGRPRHAAVAAALVMTLGGCSTWSATGSGDSGATADSPSFTSRVTSMFSGGANRLASSPDLNCPNVEFRQGAASWSVKGPGGDDGNAAMGLRYQAGLAQTGRECIASDDSLTIKVGVQGRIVLGPAGSPGTVNLPVRYALVREGAHPKTLWTRMFTVPVTVPPGQPNTTWMHVEEEMTVPRPAPQELDAYVVYVGFDSQGSGTKPPPAAKAKTARVK